MSQPPPPALDMYGSALGGGMFSHRPLASSESSAWAKQLAEQRKATLSSVQHLRSELGSRVGDPTLLSRSTSSSSAEESQSQSISVAVEQNTETTTNHRERKQERDAAQKRTQSACIRGQAVQLPPVRNILFSAPDVSRIADNPQPMIDQVQTIIQLVKNEWAQQAPAVEPKQSQSQSVQTEESSSFQDGTKSETQECEERQDESKSPSNIGTSVSPPPPQPTEVVENTLESSPCEESVPSHDHHITNRVSELPAYMRPTESWLEHIDPAPRHQHGEVSEEREHCKHEHHHHHQSQQQHENHSPPKQAASPPRKPHPRTSAFVSASDRRRMNRPRTVQPARDMHGRVPNQAAATRVLRTSKVERQSKLRALAVIDPDVALFNRHADALRKTERAAKHRTETQEELDHRRSIQAILSM